MGFGADDAHEAEKAQQAEIQAEVEAAEAQAEQDAAEPGEEPVDPAPVEEEVPTVTVKATNPDLSSACVAGYPFDFTDSDTVTDVPADIAALFEDSPNVEVVEEAV